MSKNNKFPFIFLILHYLQRMYFYLLFSPIFNLNIEQKYPLSLDQYYCRSLLVSLGEGRPQFGKTKKGQRREVAK